MIEKKIQYKQDHSYLNPTLTEIKNILKLESGGLWGQVHKAVIKSAKIIFTYCDLPN